MKIFIADFLPIKNKGEEALLRGIQSLYEEKFQENIEFFVFGPSDTIVKEDNITSFPVNWCYPMYKTPQKFIGRLGLVRKLICSLLFRVGIFLYVQNITKHQEVIEALRISDVILLAHNGFYNTFCAGLGLLLKKLGFHYSVPGTGFMPLSKYGFVTSKLDYSFFDYSSLNVLREQTCYEYLQGLKMSKELFLFPDMAFYCESNESETEQGKKLLKKYGIGLDNTKLYIGLTMCENSISFHGSFLGSKSKSDDHRKFIACLLDNITRQLNCNFIFIPHCIEDGPGNDLVIAEDIRSRMTFKEEVLIIHEDLPVNVLRPFIQSLDFMIGERTHSIINSTSMCTPYFMLTSSLDFRSHDIIGKGVGLPNQVINLDNPDIEVITNRILEGITNRVKIKQYLSDYKSTIAKSRKQLLSILPATVHNKN